VVWTKPVMMVAVRSSRHTFGIIKPGRQFLIKDRVNAIPALSMRMRIM
jgi:hypothetical protein